MPTKDFDKIIKDKDFWTLHSDAQREVLSHVDNDYAALPLESQIEVINHLNPTAKRGGAGGIYKKARPYAEPIGTGLAIARGAAMGAEAGAPGGPWGAAGGAIVGGALGYAGAERGFHALDVELGDEPGGSFAEEAKGAGQSLLRGAEYGIIGEGIGYGVTKATEGMVGLGKKVIPPIRESSIMREAGKRLKGIFGGELAPEIEQNIRIGHDLEKRIPGVKFTLGQLTNDADAIQLERALMRGKGKIERGGVMVGGPDLNQTQRAFAEKALNDYYASMTGEGDVTAVVSRVSQIKNALDENIKSAQQGVDSHVARMERVLDDQEAGGVIQPRLSATKQAQKLKAKALYDKIPLKTPVDFSLTNEAAQNVMEGFNVNAELKETLPENVLNLISGLSQKKAVTFGDLKSLRTTILSEIRKEAPKGDTILLRRLNILHDGVLKSMNTLADDPTQVGKLYREASAFYNEYATTFKQGTVAKVLQPGIRGEEYQIAAANVAGKFFTKDGIIQFQKAAGNDAAANKAMQDYARYSLHNAAYDPATASLNPNRAFNWISKNAKVLDALGIRKDLLEYAQSGRVLRQSQAALDAFNKSVASRVLQSDISEVVKKSFAGSPNYAATMQELMTAVKDDPAAIMGLKKAVAEHIIEASKTTQETPFGDFAVSYAQLTKQLQRFSPALRVLYKDNPEQLKAIMDVHKGYQMLIRTSKSPIGGGSDTAENLSGILAGMAGIATGHGWPYYFARNVKNLFGQYSKTQTDSYLLRATFDPDYAQNLIALVKDPVNKAVKGQTMRLISYGGVGVIAGRKREQETENQ